jgi:hypothetical protein
LHGTLKRSAGGFVLRADDGARWGLELGRTPVDLVEKRVRVAGVAIDTDVLQVHAIGPDAG